MAIRTGLAGLLVSSFLVGLALVVTGSEWGRARIAGLVNLALADIDGYRIVIDRLDEVSLRGLRIGEVSIAQNGRPLGRIANLDADWNLRNLILGPVRLERVSIGLLEVLGLPEGGGDSDSGPGFVVPRPPVLPVAAIEIERLEIRPPVVAREIGYRVRAVEKAGGRGEWTLTLDVTPVDAGQDRLRLEATLVPGSDRFSAMVDFHEAPGGLLARLGGLPANSELSATLAGEGTASDWQGRLVAEIGGLVRSETDLGLALVPSPRLRASGSVTLLDGVPRDLVRALGSRIDHEGEFVWRDQRLDISRLVVAARPLQLNLTGSVGPEDRSLDIAGQLRIFDLAMLLDQIRPGLGGALDIDLRASGELTRPEGNARAVGWVMDRDSGIGGELELGAVVMARDGGHDLSLDLQIRDPKGMPASLAAILGAEQRLRSRLLIDSRFHTFRLAEIAAAGGGLTISGDGLVDLPSGQAALTLNLDLADLSVPAREAGLKVGGSARARATLAGSLAPLAIDFDLGLDMSGFDPADENIAALAGRSPVLKVRGRLDEERKIILDLLRASLAEAELTASGEIDLTRDVVRVGARLDLPRLERLPVFARQDVRGGSAIEFEVAGALADPGIDGTLSGRGLMFKGHAVDAPRLSASLRGLAESPALRFRLDASVLETPLEIAGSARYEKSGLVAFQFDRAVFAALGLRGHGVTDPVSGLTNGEFVLEMRPGQTLPLPAGGSIQGEARLTLDLMHEGTFQAARASLQARSIEAGEVAIDTATAEATGSLDNLRFAIQAKGSAGPSFETAFSGAVSAVGERIGLRLGALSASVGKLNVRLAEPASLEFGSGRVQLDRTALEIAGGRLVMEGEMSEGAIRVEADLANLQMADLAELTGLADATGTGALSLRIAGSPAEVSASVDVRLTQVRAKADLPPVDSSIRAALSNGRLSADGVVEGLAEQPMVLEFGVPMRISLSPFAIELPPTSALQGSLRGPVDLARLSPFLAPGEDRLSGLAQADLKLAGTMTQPVFSGQVRLRGGTYESIATASTFSEIALDLSGDGDSLRLGGSATDGASGRLDLEGSLHPGRPGTPLALSIRASEFWLAQRDDARVKASAALSLSGNLEGVRLAGDVTILQADMAIPERLPPSVPTIDVTEINRPGGGRDMVSSAAPFPVALAVLVKAQNRVFVRGRGLESEWSGDIAVSGSAEQPILTGRLGIVRGYIDLLGKRFVLQRGTIQFAGGESLDPLIDAEAEVVRPDLTAILRVTGSLDAPEIVMSSRPELPQDEILARVMFGRGTGQLSALQALQVADSAATLTGRGGGTGFLGRFRQATGLDMLDVQAGEEGSLDARVSAGKYLTEDVLLKVEQGLTTESSRIGVEVEITPNISVETKVGPDATSEVGVNFKIDY